MKAFPDLIFLTNRGHLVAYQTAGDGHLAAIDGLEPREGNVKISDLVTDQAGAFPTGGPGSASFENLPLEEELERRAVRRIAEKIEEVLRREAPGTWGFSAAPEVNGAVLEQLPPACREKLTLNLKLDLTNVPPSLVRARFDEERQA